MKLALAIAIATLLAASHIPSPSAAAAAHRRPAAAPAPAVDCTSLIVLNMAECLSFVTNGSTATKPEKGCCSGLKTVLGTDADCLCEAFKSSGQLGVALDVSKALTLPAACDLSAPSVSNCDLSLSPAGAPGPAAAGALSPTGGNGAAAIPTPGNSAPGGRTVSSGCLVSAIAFGVFLMWESIWM